MHAVDKSCAVDMATKLSVGFGNQTFYLQNKEMDLCREFLLSVVKVLTKSWCEILKLKNIVQFLGNA